MTDYNKHNQQPSVSEAGGSCINSAHELQDRAQRDNGEARKSLIISACLIGCNTRYNGQSTKIPELEELKKKYHLIPVCPEQLGGLATPRDPAEQQNSRVITEKGADVTAQFKKGAEEVLCLAKIFDCDTALLKERSPSCGLGKIYDGTFSGTLTAGNGITADLLASSGIRVIGESRASELI